MSHYVRLPYFEQEQHTVTYLGHHYADINGLDLESPVGYQWQFDEGIIVEPPRFIEISEGANLLIVEPHPDDFALSASGLVLSELAKGGSCDVVNIFSRGSVQNFPWHEQINISQDELEQLRIAESRFAVESYLGQSFSSYRLPMASVRGNEETFGDQHYEPELAKNIGERLLAHITETEPDIVLVPAAIQGHKDHLIVFDAAMQAREETRGEQRFVLYEDYPYARNKVAYAARLAVIHEMTGLECFYIDVKPHIGHMTDLAIIYRSQFDDINRTQMLAILQQDTRATAAEATSERNLHTYEFLQRYWEVI